MKLPKGVVRHFTIKKISLDRGHRHRTVRVLMFDSARSVGAYYKDKGFKGPREITGCFCRNSRTGNSIGDICLLVVTRKFLWIIVHESFHAAFELARKCKFENDEEFIVTAGEYIAERVVKGALIKK